MLTFWRAGAAHRARGWCRSASATWPSTGSRPGSRRGDAPPPPRLRALRLRRCGVSLHHLLATEPVMWLHRAPRHRGARALARGAPRLPAARTRLPATPSAARSLRPLACALAFASKEPFVVVPALVAALAGARRRRARRDGDVSSRARPARSSRCSACSQLRRAFGVASASSQMSAPLAEHLARYGSLLVHYAALERDLPRGAPPSPPYAPLRPAARRGVGIVAGRPSRSRFRPRDGSVARRCAVVEGRALRRPVVRRRARAASCSRSPSSASGANRYGYFR